MHTRWKVCFVKMAVNNCMQRHSLITESLNRHSPHTQQLIHSIATSNSVWHSLTIHALGRSTWSRSGFGWWWTCNKHTHIEREKLRWDPILTHPKSSDMSLERVHPIAARMTITIDVQMHIWQASYRACLHHHHHHHDAVQHLHHHLHHLAWALKKGCMQVEHTKNTTTNQLEMPHS